MTFESEIESIVKRANSVLADPSLAAGSSMPGAAYFMDGNDVLALPRDNGYSRYPYGTDGFNFWVYAAGYMHGNEGLYSHFLRAAEGQEPNIAFFAGLPSGDGKFRVVSLMPVPCLGNEGPTDDVEQYTVMSSTATYFVTEVDGLQFVVRVFAAADKQICFSLRLKQQSDRTPYGLYLSSYFNPFLRHQIYESGEDRWFKEVVALDPAPGTDQLGSFRIKVNEDKDRLSSVSHYGVVRRGLFLSSSSRLVRQERTTSRFQYVGGTRSSLHTASPLRVGTFGSPQPVCTFTETAIAGDLLHLELKGEASARLDIVFHFTDDADAAGRLAGQPTNASQIDAHLRDLARDDIERHSGLTVTVGQATGPVKPKVFNAFFEHLKRQVEFCSLIKGYIQLSPNSLIGIRDVFQALEALAFWRPAATRAKMLEALGYTAPDGRCFRQYSLPSGTGQVGRMDLRPFIDQGAWVISAIATYLRVTGDTAFLEENCGYHEIVDEAAGVVRPLDKQDSVLDHLLQIMDYMLRHRDHDLTGCVRALYGDWNDALDGLGVSNDPAQTYGSGVSVMATLQVYQNCHEMIELIGVVDPEKQKYRARISEYQHAAKELYNGLVRYALVENDSGQKRILHGWGDRRGYLVGSFEDPDGLARDGLTSNAFWVLSGMYDRESSIGSTILGAFDRLDDKYGLKTFEPYFAEDAPGVGRIRKLPRGTAENGATYVHATAFAVMALFRMGQPRQAWDQLVKILPFTDIHDRLSHSPFVMPNAYGYNAEKFIDGQNMNDWQTGSSNVVLKTLIRYVFGLEPTLQGLWIQPASWLPFDGFKFAAPIRGCQVKIDYENRGGATRHFTLDGRPVQAEHDPIMNTDRLWIPYEQLPDRALTIAVVQSP